MPADYWVRPMALPDVGDVERVTAEAYHAVDVRRRRADEAEPAPRTAERAVLWRRRAEHLLRHDPGGCWVAEDRHGILGAALSMRRDLTWVLSAFAVRPGVQGRGVGRQLLDAALSYGAGCLRALLAAGDDPRALRRYRLAGFDLHPTMALTGPVPRAALPVVDRVREGSAGDVDLMNSVDRRVRDAAHGVDHELLLGSHRLLVVDRPTGSGYAYVEPAGGPHLLAATSRRVATDLLWATLAQSDPEVPVTVRRVTAANLWAVDVAMSCRMELSAQGYLCVQHMRPPAPYLPSGALL